MTRNMQDFQINGRMIGQQYPPYIVAELSANHNGDLRKALELIALAKANGADAIKIQTYTADTLTINSDKPDFQIEGGLWQGKSLYQLYDWAHTPWEWHEELFNKAREVGITLFSSPFDASAVEFLESFNVPAYKIASFEMIDHELVARVAQTGKPVIMSTGMANETEIGEAIEVALSHGCRSLVLLHCVSGYPAPAEHYNLRTMVDMAQRFKLPTGLSDHTLTNTTALTAIALGAVMVEKHFTLDRNGGGPDDSFSMEPRDLAALCEGAMSAWQSLGQVSYERSMDEQKNLVFRRSLYVVKNITKGECFTPENVRSIRPGYGLAPKCLPAILGKPATCDIEAGSRMAWDYVGEIHEDPKVKA